MLLELYKRYVQKKFVTKKLNSKKYKILPVNILLKVTNSFCRLDHNLHGIYETIHALNTLTNLTFLQKSGFFSLHFLASSAQEFSKNLQNISGKSSSFGFAIQGLSSKEAN